MLVATGLAGLERAAEDLTANRAVRSRVGAGPPSGEEVLRLNRLVERLVVLRAAWADQFEAGSEWAADGARSGSAWVAARGHEHPASARTRVHAGRDLRAVPRMAAAALAGEVRIGHVRLLMGAARAKDHRMAALADVETLATESAARLSEPRFARFVERWAALADAHHDDELRADGVEVPAVDHADAEQAQRRELFLSRYGTDGMWALNGTLDTETGLALSAALESLCEAIRGDDPPRELAQLRHDALGVLLSGELSAGLPVHKGVRPHVMVVVSQAGTRHAGCATDRDQLMGDRGGDAPAASGAPGAPAASGAPGAPAASGAPAAPAVPAGRAFPMRLAAPTHAELLDRCDGESGVLWLSGLARQRLSCDAVVQRLTVDSRGVPLDLGRSARVVPPALRKVIDVRDRHCTFAGCTAAAMWCQAHHLVHWEHGGGTDERNLALTCSFHHRSIHERGFELRWSPDGTSIHTVRPNGSVITIPESR